MKSLRRATPAEEAAQRSRALLRMLAQSNRSVREGRYKPVAEAFRDLVSRIREEKRGVDHA